MNNAIDKLFIVIRKLERELGYTSDIHNLQNIGNELINELPLTFEKWVANEVSCDPEYVGEDGLMRALESEDFMEAYKEYLYEQFN